MRAARAYYRRASAPSPVVVGQFDQRQFVRQGGRTVAMSEWSAGLRRIGAEVVLPGRERWSIELGHADRQVQCDGILRRRAQGRLGRSVDRWLYVLALPRSKGSRGSQWLTRPSAAAMPRRQSTIFRRGACRHGARRWRVRSTASSARLVTHASDGRHAAETTRCRARSASSERSCRAGIEAC